MNIRNNTIIDEKTYTDFQLFRRQLIKRSRPLSLVIYGILCAAVLAMLVYSFLMLNLYYIIGSAIFAFLLFREIDNHILKPKKMFRKNKLQPVSVQYLFLRNSYKIIETTEENAQAVHYEQIAKLYDTPAYLYFFFQKNLAHIVAKSAFSSADSKKITDILSDKLGKKYIICK